MSKLEIRAPNKTWLNICDTVWKYRQSNSWFTLDPFNQKIKVRNSTNTKWLDVVCERETELCPPSTDADCWPGYSGDFGGSLLTTGGVTGYKVCKCDGTTCKTYTGHGPDYSLSGGKFTVTSSTYGSTVAYALPCTVFGATAEVNEVLVYAGTQSGMIDFSLHDLDGGSRLRIYRGCELLADSAVSGPHFDLLYTYENEDDIAFLTVRVDTTLNHRWRVKIGDVGAEQLTTYQHTAPCFGTFGPRLPCFTSNDGIPISGTAAYEMVHYVPTSGKVLIDLRVLGDETVNFMVYYAGQKLVDFSTTNSSTTPDYYGTLTFDYAPENGDYMLIVRYVSMRQNNNWSYTMFCPDQHGSYADPITTFATVDPCATSSDGTLAGLTGSNVVSGGGTTYTDIIYDLGSSYSGSILFDYDTPSLTQFVVYQGIFPSETILWGTPSPTAGRSRRTISFDSVNGNIVHVRVIGPCCPAWKIQLSKTPQMSISVSSPTVTRPGSGSTINMCFDITLTTGSDVPIYFDYVTKDGSAVGGSSCTGSYDYLTQSGTTNFGTCETSMQICVPVCGTDSPGPTTTMTLVLSNITNYSGSVKGTGTILNKAVANCPQNTLLAVHDYGANTLVGYGAHNIYTDSLVVNGGSQYVMDRHFTITASGTYTILFYAADFGDLYIDCTKVGASSGTLSRTQVHLNEGSRYIYTDYTLADGTAHTGYSCVCILDSSNNVIMTSQAADWKGKKLSAGSAIDCTQFHDSACTVATQTWSVGCDPDLGGEEDRPFGYSDYTDECSAFASSVQYLYSTLLGMGNLRWDAPYVTITCTFNFPYSGSYTAYYFADDIGTMYIDGQSIVTSTSNWRTVKATFSASAGTHKIGLAHRNVKDKTVCGAAFAILDSGGNLICYSNPNLSGLTAYLGDIYQNGCAENTGDSDGYSTANSIGAVPLRAQAQPDDRVTDIHSYTVRFPTSLPAGQYSIAWAADDEGKLYVDCNLIASKSGFSDTSATTVSVSANPTISIYYHNTQWKTQSWFCFTVKDSNNNVVLTSSPSLTAKQFYGDIMAAVSSSTRSLYESVQPWSNGWYCLSYAPDPNNGNGVVPENSYWCAELDFTFPAAGNYIIGNHTADDSIDIYVGCKRRCTFVMEGDKPDPVAFSMPAGATKIQVRIYQINATNYFYFEIRNADTGAVVYTSRAAGWKARLGDLDFTNLSN